MPSGWGMDYLSSVRSFFVDISDCTNIRFLNHIHIWQVSLQYVKYERYTVQQVVILEKKRNG